MPARTSARTGSSARAPRVLAALLTAVLALLAGAFSLAVAGPASAATCLTCDGGDAPAPRTTTKPVTTPTPTPTTSPVLLPVLSKGPQTDYIDGDSDQVMTTSVSWLRSGNAFAATTRITNHSTTTGFTGGVVILAQNAAGQVVGYSQPQQWGVDCNAIWCSGPTDRTMSWSGSLSGAPSSATSLVVVQWHWGKNRFVGDFATLAAYMQCAILSGEMTAQVVAMFS